MLTAVEAPSPPPAPPPGPQPVEVVDPLPVPLPAQITNLPVQEDGLPKLLVDWAQVGGALLGLIAIVVSLIALGKAKRDLTKERKRQHELEILRDLGNEIYGARDQHKHLIRSQLLVFNPTGADFPMTRVALGLPVSQLQKTAYSTAYDTWLRLSTKAHFDHPWRRDKVIDFESELTKRRDHSSSHWGFLYSSTDELAPSDRSQSRIAAELHDAIKRRLK